MINVRHWPEELSRSPDKACYWTAEAEVGGQLYVRRSRNGAVEELARALVAAGIPDDEMAVAGLNGIAVGLRYRSFHAAARRTFKERIGRPLKSEPYVAFAGAPNA